MAAARELLRTVGATDFARHARLATRIDAAFGFGLIWRGLGRIGAFVMRPPLR